MNEFLVFGHRGAKGYIMENTLESIAYALELGVNAIEIDVFVCASGELVVFHDDQLNRLSAHEGQIELLELEELKKIKLNGGYTIPTLSEVLHFIDDKVILNIELKGENTAKKVFQLLESIYNQHVFSKTNIIISSFHEQELRIYRNLDSEMKIGVLTKEDWNEDLKLAIDLNAFSVHPHKDQLTSARVQRVQALSFKVFPFTVNEKEEIASFMEMGVDGLFCDYPDRAL